MGHVQLLGRNVHLVTTPSSPSYTKYPTREGNLRTSGQNKIILRSLSKVNMMKGIAEGPLLFGRTATIYDLL